MMTTKKPTPRRATKDEAAAMIADGLFAIARSLDRIGRAIEEHTQREHPSEEKRKEFYRDVPGSENAV